MGKYDPWDQFFEHLDGDEVRFTLDDLEEITGVQLPPSARKWQPWWGGTPYYAYWRKHGWHVSTRLGEGAVIFSRRPGRAGRPRQLHSVSLDLRAELPPAASDADLVLIGCVKSKLSEPARAKDLYTSTLWHGRRRYAEATGKPWFILSAEHGLVEPDAVLAPYDRYMEAEPRAYRETWARQTAQQILHKSEELAARSVEIHAGKAYVEFGLERALLEAGLTVVRPLEGLRQGEQLAWYTRPDATPPHGAATPFAVGEPVEATSEHVAKLAETYRSRVLGESWSELPESWNSPDATPRGKRLWITFVAAVDRARDAARLWRAAHDAWENERWIFEPNEIVDRRSSELAEVLRAYGVSQRHSVDISGWRTIAEALVDARCPVAISDAIEGQPASAKAILAGLAATWPRGTKMFPLLSGPKIGPMWTRMLAWPGGSPISDIDVIPVAVDTHVQRVTEMLGLVSVRDLDDGHRRAIQQVWFDAVSAAGQFGAPGLIDGTAAGIDPAVWALGKEGCSRCEQAGIKKPVGPICDLCPLGRVNAT